MIIEPYFNMFICIEEPRSTSITCFEQSPSFDRFGSRFPACSRVIFRGNQGTAKENLASVGPKCKNAAGSALHATAFDRSMLRLQAHAAAACSLRQAAEWKCSWELEGQDVCPMLAVLRGFPGRLRLRTDQRGLVAAIRGGPEARYGPARCPSGLSTHVDVSR